MNNSNDLYFFVYMNIIKVKYLICGIAKLLLTGIARLYKIDKIPPRVSMTQDLFKIYDLGNGWCHSNQLKHEYLCQ